MKVDETIESVGRVWEQVTILIVLHVVFFGLAVIAGLVSITSVDVALQDVRTLSPLQRLYGLEDSFKRAGFDLPVVAGVACVVYLVTFQRLSMLVGRLPCIRLKYSQPDLWRSGKCFDELRQLVHHFEGYTASPALEDVEVTLGLAIAQNTEHYAEHYSELVGSPLAKAKTLSDYFSGFCLVTVCAILWLLLRPSSDVRAGMIVLPFGLGIACLVSRVGWERQIEYAVLGRLSFAVNCAVIAGQVSQQGSETVARNGDVDFRSTTILSDASLDNLLWSSFAFARGDLQFDIRDEDKAQGLSVLLRDLSLAAALLSPASVRDRLQHIWISHLVQRIVPWPPSAIPVVPNDRFRAWLHETIMPHLAKFCRTWESLETIKHNRFSERIDSIRTGEIRRALANPQLMQIIDRPFNLHGIAPDGTLPPASFRRWLKKRRRGRVPTRESMRDDGQASE